MKSRCVYRAILFCLHPSFRRIVKSVFGKMPSGRVFQGIPVEAWLHPPLTASGHGGVCHLQGVFLARSPQAPLPASYGICGVRRISLSFAAKPSIARACRTARYVVIPRLLLRREYFVLRRVRKRHIKRHLLARYGFALLHGARHGFALIRAARRARAQHVSEVGFSVRS